MEHQARTVSIVVPTYDNPSLLLDCLGSLRRLRYAGPKPEIIVVDNSPTQATAQALRNRFPEVKLVSMGKNAGFAPGCNRGDRRGHRGVRGLHQRRR